MPMLRVLQELSDRMAGTQAVASWVVAASAAVALVVVLGTRTWHLARSAITIAHEGGHAFAALILGARLLYPGALHLPHPAALGRLG
jgi:hypothetical protein